MECLGNTVFLVLILFQSRWIWVGSSQESPKAQRSSQSPSLRSLVGSVQGRYFWGTFGFPRGRGGTADAPSGLQVYPCHFGGTGVVAPGGSKYLLRRSDQRAHGCYGLCVPNNQDLLDLPTVQHFRVFIHKAKFGRHVADWEHLQQGSRNKKRLSQNTGTLQYLVYLETTGKL